MRIYHQKLQFLDWGLELGDWIFGIGIWGFNWGMGAWNGFGEFYFSPDLFFLN